MVEKRNTERKNVGKNRTSETNKLAIKLFVLISLLLWLFPNLVHEPLHLLALALTGNEGEIMFDFSFPATPVTSYEFKEGTNIAQALFVQLFPAAIQLIMLISLTFVRTKYVLTELALTSYLAFDAIINIKGYVSPISDFRALQVIPELVPVLVLLVLIIWLKSLKIDFKQMKKINYLKLKSENK